ncbi:protein PRRC2A isoform X1 [Nematostella vectensis]|uniref:protein PRRC2A isoform X1 n=1 Tax=Nematostella vectensis TaxID=45351 RepID=UPI002076E382|nr:protein PRRC2A isoform X1 [Nematostella vectensis]
MGNALNTNPPGFQHPGSVSNNLLRPPPPPPTRPFERNIHPRTEPRDRERPPPPPPPRFYDNDIPPPPPPRRGFYDDYPPPPPPPRRDEKSYDYDDSWDRGPGRPHDDRYDYGKFGRPRYDERYDLERFDRGPDLRKEWDMDRGRGRETDIDRGSRMASGRGVRGRGDERSRSMDLGRGERGRGIDFGRADRGRGINLGRSDRGRAIDFSRCERGRGMDFGRGKRGPGINFGRAKRGCGMGTVNNGSGQSGNRGRGLNRGPGSMKGPNQNRGRGQGPNRGGTGRGRGPGPYPYGGGYKKDTLSKNIGIPARLNQPIKPFNTQATPGESPNPAPATEGTKINTTVTSKPAWLTQNPNTTTTTTIAPAAEGTKSNTTVTSKPAWLTQNSNTTTTTTIAPAPEGTKSNTTVTSKPAWLTQNSNTTTTTSTIATPKTPDTTAASSADTSSPNAPTPSFVQSNSQPKPKPAWLTQAPTQQTSGLVAPIKPKLINQPITKGCENIKVPIPGDDNFISFKNSLQEFAQKKGIPVPRYFSKKAQIGMMSTVVISDHKFHSTGLHKDKKQSEQNAAWFALKKLGIIPVETIFTPLRVAAKRPASTLPETVAKKLKGEDLPKAPSYKSQLNEFCQKFHLAIPQYRTQREARGYVCTMLYNKKVYHSTVPLKNKKAAEQNVAQYVLSTVNQAPPPTDVSGMEALQKVVNVTAQKEPDGTTTAVATTSTAIPIGSAEELLEVEGGPVISYKNQLQEYCDKNKKGAPIYDSKKVELQVDGKFVCDLLVDGFTFRAKGCQTKKGSEQSAARIALQRFGVLKE